MWTKLEGYGKIIFISIIRGMEMNREFPSSEEKKQQLEGQEQARTYQEGEVRGAVGVCNAVGTNSQVTGGKQVGRELEIYKGNSFEIGYPKDWHVGEKQQLDSLIDEKIQKEKTKVLRQLIGKAEDKEEMALMALLGGPIIDTLMDNFINVMVEPRENYVEKVAFSTDSKFEAPVVQVGVLPISKVGGIKEYIDSTRQRAQLIQNMASMGGAEFQTNEENLIETRLGGKKAYTLSYRMKDPNTGEVTVGISTYTQVGDNVIAISTASKEATLKKILAVQRDMVKINRNKGISVDIKTFYK